jgi:hypothetical protein
VIPFATSDTSSRRMNVVPLPGRRRGQEQMRPLYLEASSVGRSLGPIMVALGPSALGPIPSFPLTHGHSSLGASADRSSSVTVPSRLFDSPATIFCHDAKLASAIDSFRQIL